MAARQGLQLFEPVREMRASLMSPSPTPASDGPLQSCCERVCASLVESRWRALPGLALRISRVAVGIVEKPGRTRFDLRMAGATQRLEGLLQAYSQNLPLADGTLALLLLDRLGMRRTALKPLLAEAMRVLAEDGHLLVIDYSPLGWLGWRRRWQGEALAAGANGIAGGLRAAGFEDIEVERALRLPPLPGALLERLRAPFERGYGWPLPASLQLVGARKRRSNVIAVPFARDRRRALVTAPEGMRRAG